MIDIIEGDLFSSHADVLVNPVNIIGTMGAGLAKRFATTYPVIMKPYKERCDSGWFNKGALQWIRVNDETMVLNFPTKYDWRNDASYDLIEQGLKSFTSTYFSYGIGSAAFPLLGCGLGNLNHHKVIELMTKHLKPHDVECTVYLYRG